MPTTLLLILIAVVGTAALLRSRVRLAVDVECQDSCRTRWRLQWLGGLVDVTGSTALRTEPSQTDPPSSEAHPRTATTAHRRASRAGRRVSIERWLGIASTPGLGRSFARLVADLRRAFTLEAFYADGTFGLDDPADTGRVFALAAPFLVWARQACLDLNVCPVFDEVGVRGVCGGRASLCPMRLVSSCVRFTLSRPFWHGLTRLTMGR